MTDLAEKLSEQVRAYGHDHCVEVAFIHTQGDTAKELLRIANSDHADLLVVGAPPRPAIASLVRWVDGLSVDAGHRSSSWFLDVKGRHDERGFVRCTGQESRRLPIEDRDMNRQCSRAD